MLPIFTTEQVRDGIDTDDLLIDLSDYIKKKDAATKTDIEALTTVIAGKLDATPQHKHDISNVKDLQEELDSKYDTSKRYPHNVILSDTEKISYLEAPKIELLELVKNKEAEGYKFYVDESNGDLMITLDGVLIGSYSIASGKWSWESNGNYADANHTHTSLDGYVLHNGPHHKYYSQKFIPTVETNGVLDIGKYIDFHDYGGGTPGDPQNYNVRFENSKEKLSIYSMVPNGNTDKKQNAQLRVYGDLDLWQYTTNAETGAVESSWQGRICGTPGGGSTIPGNLTVKGDVTSKGSLILNGTQSANAGPNIYMGSVEMRTAQNVLNTWIGGTLTHTINADGVKVNGTLTVTDSLTATPSQTKISSQETLLNSSITKTGGQLDVGGTINSVVSGHKLGILTIDKPYLRYWNENLDTAEDKNLYFQIGRNNSKDSDCFWMHYTYPGQMLFKFYGGGSTNFLTMNKNTPLMTIHQNVKVEKDLDVTGKITCANIEACNRITVKNSKKNDTAHFFVGGTDDNDTFLEIATTDNGNEPIYVRQYHPNNVLSHSATLLDANGNTSFPGNLSVGGTLTVSDMNVTEVLENHYDALNAVCNATLINITDINTNAAAIATMQTKITQMEAILQNHYQALMLLLEKHDMIDADTNDGANITPVMEE